jgi:formylglycine-generating enzyme required for sulfatase activity
MPNVGLDIGLVLGIAVCMAVGCEGSRSIEADTPTSVRSNVVAASTETPAPPEKGTAPPPKAAADRCLSDSVAVSIGRTSHSGSEPSRSMCFDRSEVTVAAYTACVKAGQCTEPNAYAVDDQYERHRVFCNWRHPEDRASHPVNCVAFEQAHAYCAARGGRLPTDVEWTWVASNGGRTRYAWGDVAPDGTRVNGCGLECPDAVKALTNNPGLRPTYKQNDGYVATAPVGSFPKGDNALGIHDLAGNVAEFVSRVSSAESTGDLITGGSCFSRKLREMAANEFNRTSWSGATSPSLGFRCVLE